MIALLLAGIVGGAFAWVTVVVVEWLLKRMRNLLTKAKTR